MARMRLLAGTAVLLLAAGCSSTAPDPTPAATPTATTSSAPPPPSAAPSAVPCPDGAYLLTGFEGRGDASAVGRGSGGTIAVAFTSGTFTIASDGAQPVTLDLGSIDAELRFDGQIAGTYEGPPDALRLTTTSARGNAVVKGLGVSRTYPVDRFADQLIGQGATAQVTCDEAAGTAEIVLPSATLHLGRAGR